MAVILQPPLPIIRDTTEAGTESFFDLKTHQMCALEPEKGPPKKKGHEQPLTLFVLYLRTTSFHPSSLFWPLLGLVRFILLLGEVTGSEMVLKDEGRELGVKSLIIS